MGHGPRVWIVRYGFAVLTTVVATWARVGISDAVGDRMPFGLYFLSVVVAVCVAGIGPAVVSLLLGVLAAAWWVIPPENSLLVHDTADQISLIVYILVGCASITIYWQAERRQQTVNLRSSDCAKMSHALKEADRRKDNWLALLAHELRNPLAPIRSGIDLLDREELQPEASRELRATMRRQTEQLVRIVEDLLDVSLYTRGQLRLECESVNLREIVSQAIALTRPIIDQNQHSLQVIHFPEPLIVDGDSMRLVQVVSNLLTNAAKYTPRGGRIQIFLEGDETEAKICVADNGIGIAKEAQQRVFDLFIQAESPRDRDRQGLGIGLALVRSLVEMHSGRITLHSAGPGKGSQFTICLPRIAPPKEHVPASSNPQSQAPSRISSLQGVKILIVDDNEDAVSTLCALLSIDGCETFHAHDGPAGLDLFHEVQPQIVLLDIGMPGMDGYEVVRRIRRVSLLQRPRVIAVSGWGSEVDRHRSRAAGFDDHLVKPIDYQQLVRVLVEKRDAELVARSHPR